MKPEPLRPDQQGKPPTQRPLPAHPFAAVTGLYRRQHGPGRSERGVRIPVPRRGLRLLAMLLVVLSGLGIIVTAERSGAFYSDRDTVQGNSILMADPPTATPTPSPTATATRTPKPTRTALPTSMPASTSQPTKPPACEDDPALCATGAPAVEPTSAPTTTPTATPPEPTATPPPAELTATPPPPTQEPTEAPSEPPPGDPAGTTGESTPQQLQVNLRP